LRAIDERTFSQTPVWVFLCLFCSDWPVLGRCLPPKSRPRQGTKPANCKVAAPWTAYGSGLSISCCWWQLGIWLIGGAVIGFVVALLSRARSRVWVSLGGVLGTFIGSVGMVVGFGILAAIFGIKGGGAHGGAQAGFIILLLFGAPLGAIFGSLLVRKLTGEQESPREKIKHKGFWIALAAVVLVGLGAAWKWDKIRLWYIARSDDGLVGANLRHARLSGVDLTGVNLTKAILAGADLRTANLRGANLEEAILNSARLWGADLSGVNLRGAHLRGADLGNAKLTRADLRGADLQDADLRGATGVNLEGTLGTPAFMPDD